VSDSPYVNRLLDGILRRGEEDAKALKRIAQSVLDSPHGRFASVVADGRTLYPMSRQDLFKFLRLSGIEQWHTSTWLTMDEDDTLDSDAPMADEQSNADARLAALTESIWRSYLIDSPPVAFRGMEVLVFGVNHLGVLLDDARDIARRNPDWTAATLMKSMQTVLAAGSVARNDSSAQPSAEPQVRKPRPS